MVCAVLSLKTYYLSAVWAVCKAPEPHLRQQCQPKEKQVVQLDHGEVRINAVGVFDRQKDGDGTTKVKKKSGVVDQLGKQAAYYDHACIPFTTSTHPHVEVFG